ncbi:amidohydrolase family protein [Ilumatobacter sp.]|uniref:amidohydrolase family protein n=1 Tax=Ilumatobacter sp. TaxID=1967498 RepID=UPI003C6FCD4B
MDVVDAAGCWVTPGFVDLHTHYDADVEVHPQLSESLRHGVTTALIGSCGLSLVVGEPEDLAEPFCRVEGIPRDTVLPLLEKIVDWTSPAEYVDHLRSLPLGPNIVGMLGHSTARSHVMGLGRSLEPCSRPRARSTRCVASSCESIAGRNRSSRSSTSGWRTATTSAGTAWSPTRTRTVSNRS